MDCILNIATSYKENRTKKMKLLLTLATIAIMPSTSAFAGVDRSIGHGEVPQLAPDERTPLQVIGHELIGGSRYRGFLLNQAQGLLTDLATGQKWYIYLEFGEPGSGGLTWYAQPE